MCVFVSLCVCVCVCLCVSLCVHMLAGVCVWFRMWVRECVSVCLFGGVNRVLRWWNCVLFVKVNGSAGIWCLFDLLTREKKRLSKLTSLLPLYPYLSELPRPSTYIWTKPSLVQHQYLSELTLYHWFNINIFRTNTITNFVWDNIAEGHWVSEW